VQSSFRDRLMSPERSRRLTQRWLARLKLDPADPGTAARLATWPHAELMAAMDAALADEQRDAQAAGERFVPPVMLSYGPTHDGRTLPWQPHEPAAAALAAKVPLIIGSTHHEFGAATRPPALRGATDAQIEAEGQRRHGARFAQLLAAHRAAHPGWPASDWLDTDVHFRQLAVTLAERHAAAGGRVWRYLFDWPSPVLDGFFKVGHGAELPFMFDETERRAEATGGGPVPRALAAQVSAAWRAFARDGDPRAGLPQWQPYTPAGGETLWIDVQPQLRRHPDRDWLCLHRPGCTPAQP
jgi:para-nitrobenzyl esterase